MIHREKHRNIRRFCLCSPHEGSTDYRWVCNYLYWKDYYFAD